MLPFFQTVRKSPHKILEKDMGVLLEKLKLSNPGEGHWCEMVGVIGKIGFNRIQQKLPGKPRFSLFPSNGVDK